MGTTERSKPPLHNFKMPCLKWGSQKFLRCKKARSSVFDFDMTVEKFLIGRRNDSLKKALSPSEDVGGSERKSEAKNNVDDGIDAVRETLMFDMHIAADKMKFAILGEGIKETQAVVVELESVMPWNLRTRRDVCKTPKGTNCAIGGGSTDGGANCLKIDAGKPNFSLLRTENNKFPRFSGNSITDASAANALSDRKRERAKFSVSLSRRDIEFDFMLLAGHKPHRRPRKRPKIVQKQLDSLSPGLWLTEVTADIYKVC